MTKPKYKYDDLSLQFAFTPNRFIDIKNDKWKSTVEELTYAKSLGASRMNIWFLVGELFHKTGSFDTLNPEAEACYQDLIEHCNRLEMGVVGKIGHWNIPWWFDSKQGVPRKGTLDYTRHLHAHEKIAEKLVGTFACDAWMCGNETLIESRLYGHAPGDLATWPAVEAIEFAIDKTNVVAPIFSDNGRIVIGYCMEGMKFTKDMLLTYWDGCGEHLDYMGVNAYMGRVARPSYNNYARYYGDLAEIVSLWPSEQNIPRAWYNGTLWLEDMISLTPYFSKIFSYFVLTEIRDSDQNWCLIYGDGQVDEHREAL